MKIRNIISSKKEDNRGLANMISGVISKIQNPLNSIQLKKDIFNLLNQLESLYKKMGNDVEVNNISILK